MSPSDAAAALAYQQDARQAFALIIGLGLLLVMLAGWMPLGCDQCAHCQRERSERDAAERTRERLFGREILRDDQDASGTPGQPGEREGDVPGVVVPDGPADQAARPVEVEAPNDSGNAPS